MQRNGEGIRIVIEIEVSDMDRFKALAAEAVAISREEPGTVVYDWYTDEDAGTARLYEAYVSREALDEHVSGRVFSDLGASFMEVCSFTKADVFGDYGERPETSLWPTTYWGEAVATVST